MSEKKLSREARVRLGEVFSQFETNRQPSRYAIVRFRSSANIESLGEAAPRVIRTAFGVELEVDPFDIRGFCLGANVDQLTYFVMGAFVHLNDLARLGAFDPEVPHHFAERVNAILGDDGFELVFDEKKGSWIPRVSSDAEALRRALLGNPSDLATCRQGDPQVEMVVSTVQAALARPDPTLVDYGSGLGRVLASFATADRFKGATYVAVDEPVVAEVRALANTVAARFVPKSREAYLETPVSADAIILLNTLHHIPFEDLPRQIAALLASLKPGGVLVVQEIGELRQPEQRNVPWHIEDISGLFKIPGCTSNPRSTMTRTQRIPLTHMIVHVEQPPPTRGVLEEALESTSRAVWSGMKDRTLADIRALYASRDPKEELALHHLLIANANLDLNRPK